MKTVSARQANHDFSELLSRVERGEEILITRRSRPVALLSPYRHSHVHMRGRIEDAPRMCGRASSPLLSPHEFLAHLRSLQELR